MTVQTLAHRPFWFLRHGQTDWNAQSLAQGRVEIALNATGMAQAHAAAEALAGKGIARIVTSPLIRAQVTAQVVAEALGLPVSVDDDLVEAAFGDHEGQPMSDWFHHWVAGDYTPPGGEAFADLRARAARAVNRHTETAEAAADGPVLIVAHGALMRALRAGMNLQADYRTPNAVPIFCEPPNAQADIQAQSSAHQSSAHQSSAQAGVWTLHGITPA